MSTPVALTQSLSDAALGQFTGITSPWYHSYHIQTGTVLQFLIQPPCYRHHSAIHHTACLSPLLTPLAIICSGCHNANPLADVLEDSSELLINLFSSSFSPSTHCTGLWTLNSGHAVPTPSLLFLSSSPLPLLCPGPEGKLPGSTSPNVPLPTSPPSQSS